MKSNTNSIIFKQQKPDINTVNALQSHALNSFAIMSFPMKIFNFLYNGSLACEFRSAMSLKYTLDFKDLL